MLKYNSCILCCYRCDLLQVFLFKGCSLIEVHSDSSPSPTTRPAPSFFVHLDRALLRATYPFSQVQRSHSALQFASLHYSLLAYKAGKGSWLCSFIVLSRALFQRLCDDIERSIERIELQLASYLVASTEALEGFVLLVSVFLEFQVLKMLIQQEFNSSPTPFFYQLSGTPEDDLIDREEATDQERPGQSFNLFSSVIPEPEMQLWFL